MNDGIFKKIIGFLGVATAIWGPGHIEETTAIMTNHQDATYTMAAPAIYD